MLLLESQVGRRNFSTDNGYEHVALKSTYINKSFKVALNTYGKNLFVCIQSTFFLKAACVLLTSVYNA